MLFLFILLFLITNLSINQLLEFGNIDVSYSCVAFFKRGAYREIRLLCGTGERIVIIGD